MFVWLGLIINLLVWIGIATLLIKWHDKGLGSISAHGSSAKGAARLFQVVLIGGGVALYWWLVRWFVPQLQLPVIFTVILTVVIAYQLATALNNGTHGLSKDIHNYTAQAMSLLYIPLSILILESSKLTPVARILCICLTVYLVNSYVLVEVMKKFRDMHLVFQALYIVAFQLVILVSAYVRV